MKICMSMYIYMGIFHNPTLIQKYLTETSILAWCRLEMLYNLIVEMSSSCSATHRNSKLSEGFMILRETHKSRFSNGLVTLCIFYAFIMTYSIPLSSTLFFVSSHHAFAATACFNSPL